MKKTNYLQIGIFVVFGLAIIFATLLFSGKLPFGQSSSEGVKGNLVMWGTFPSSVVTPVLESARQVYKDLNVTYISKNEATFDNELLSALASGKGPDLFFVGHDDLKKRTPQLFEIPFANFPESTYKATFIDQADRNLTSTGVIAVPVTVDPLVLYYNKDLLSSGFLVAPPKTWREVIEMTPSLAVKTDAGVISQSSIAMGSYDNITHAKDIMSLLALQAGSKIVTYDGTRYFASLTDTDSSRAVPFANAMNLYLSFAKPDNPSYTWNPSLPEDKNMFLAGKLAFYLGYASELDSIRSRNPNLNFDVSYVPQPVSATRVMTFGRIYSLGVSTLSSNKGIAVTFANWFTGADAVKEFSDLTNAVPARKDLLANKPKDDARKVIFYNSAIASKSWYDPDTAATSGLFRRLVTQVQSGATTLDTILPQLNQNLNSLLPKK